MVDFTLFSPFYEAADKTIEISFIFIETNGSF
jgi:hypothetical protein